MTIEDFFGCNWDEYARRISAYTNERLRQQEVNKTRQKVSASCSIVGGVGGAVFTGGGSLAMSAIGSRRLRVASKKLELIQKELTRRNIPLHSPTTRDFLLPAGASLVGMGVGFGVDAVATAATNTLPMDAYTPTGSTALSAVAANPGDALHGIIPGFIEQIKEMGLAFHGAADGIIPGSDLSHATLVAHTTWVALPDQGASVGVYAGMLLAQTGEKAIANVISAQCAWWIMEALAPLESPGSQLPCHQMVDMPVECSHCITLMTAGTYWHCCACDHKFNVCNSCHKSGKRCPKTLHTLTKRQIALNADFTVLHYEPLYPNWNLEGYTWSRNRLIGHWFFICSVCISEITQGMIFHCDSGCNQGEFNLCESCYLAGNTCHGESHALVSDVCAIDCSSNPRFVSDCCRNRVGVKNLLCEHCKQKIHQGRYYHCCLCPGDKFDLCHACYKKGARCQNPTKHPLMLQMAGRGMILDSFPPACRCVHRQVLTAKQMRTGCCDICAQVIGAAPFWHCCSCNDGQFDICAPCYRKGGGCNNSSHRMLLCDASGE